jgi:uncharacterized membrane protein YoaK (UPF0700 family)
MRLADSFAERSVRGALTRMVGSWLAVGLPVIAARVWWSWEAALAIFVVAVAAYVAGSRRYMRHHRPAG